MNTKQCIYRDCDNTNLYTPDLTFFGFPVKDVQKCNLWVELSGCDEVNLKNKYLCQNHFDQKYISKSARRTVLLPNAVPFRYNEKSTKDQENYVEEDYNSEKNMSHDDILMDPLEEQIYTNTIEMLTQPVDENDDAIEEGLSDEELQNEKEKIKSVKVTQKTYDHFPAVRNKKIDEITDKRRISTGELVNHVTKRQKLYTSADNIIVSNHMNEIKKTTVDNDDTNDEDKTNAFDNTVDNPDITTFIYKGEEYIQMPKRIYLQQRAKLDADVKQYRHIVQNIKNLVNTTD
ncbi:uncharacterized protein LOC116337933 [Contarinia nasturtii]|uniref:uncharacterized protein LOC116337933 n=1 Tax=Contarinia nasturtii TaxID=265458 RepID=UPI0012D3AAA3|nr:uncharacterized protein LOC116337933 [Contarinia nasturtii]